jgi:hypothetical protein
MQKVYAQIYTKLGGKYTNVIVVKLLGIMVKA